MVPTLRPEQNMESEPEYKLTVIKVGKHDEVKKAISHDALQALCYQWHVSTFKEDRHLVHANVSNSVGGRYGSHNTAIGVKKGRSDLQYYKAGCLYLFEFKVGKDSQKPEQKVFQEANEAEGAKYFIIRSLEDYQDIIISIRQG